MNTTFFSAHGVDFERFSDALIHAEQSFDGWRPTIVRCEPVAGGSVVTGEWRYENGRYRLVEDRSGPAWFAHLCELHAARNGAGHQGELALRVAC